METSLRFFVRRIRPQGKAIANISCRLQYLISLAYIYTNIELEINKRRKGQNNVEQIFRRMF